MKIINLLPKNKQAEVYFNELYSISFKLIWVTIFGLIIILLTQYGVKAILQNRVKKVEVQITELQAFSSLADNASVKNKVVEENALILDYKTLSENIPKNSKVIRAFASLVPDGVVIKQMKLNTSKKLIEINGFALTRELVIRMYDKLVENAKLFPNVDYPLENVAKPININFHFTFNISDELLK